MGLKRLQPESFDLKCTTVWSFPKRGNWATHRSDYRGNWSPQVARNLLLRYSNEGDTILDPMVGGGTTLIECKLTGREGVGIDINPHALNIAKERLSFDYLYSHPQSLTLGDARNLESIENNSIDFVLTHPPYADIIKVQHNCKATGFWVKKSKEYNILLIMHEHLFVFYRP